MARRCSICASDRLPEVNRELVAGEPSTAIAARYFTLSARMAVQRHREQHLPPTLARAQDAAEVAEADDLLGQLRTLQARALGILDRAETAGDLRNALGAIREARGCLELLAKLLGELDERPQVNVLVAPEWLALRGVLLAALAPYAEARAAVSASLLALEGRSNGHAG